MNDERKSAINEIASKPSVIEEGTKTKQSLEQTQVVETKSQNDDFAKRKAIVKKEVVSRAEAERQGKLNNSPKADEDKKKEKSNSKDEDKKRVLGQEKKSGIRKSSEANNKDGGNRYGIKKESSVKKNHEKNKKGVRIKSPTGVAAKQMKETIKMKRIRQFIEAENTEDMIDIAQRSGIQALVAMIQAVIKLILKAMASITIKLAILLMPVFLFMAPVIFITVCIAGFGGSPTYQKNFDENLPFGIDGNLNYVSYIQGRYEVKYNESGWCGITSYTDILASYGCTSPYRKGELINPCDAVRYADESGTAIIGAKDGTHYLNENWYSTLCGEYGLEFEAVRSDHDVYGQKLFEWVNEKLDDGWQVVVCFDSYAKYESGAYITKNKHYIWLVCYADSNHETYACIDPGNGCADSTFLSEATVEGGYRDLIVNKSQILNYTGGTNFITGFAVRNPENNTETTEADSE